MWKMWKMWISTSMPCNISKKYPQPILLYWKNIGCG